MPPHPPLFESGTLSDSFHDSGSILGLFTLNETNSAKQSQIRNLSIFKVYSHQAKAESKANEIKEKTINTKGNVCFLFRSV